LVSALFVFLGLSFKSIVCYYNIINFSCLFQIVLNHLLEEEQDEDRATKKDKAGNGLKCKNRPQNQPETSSSQFEDDEMVAKRPAQGQGTSRAKRPTDVSSAALVTDITVTQPRQTKRKLPPPSATVTSESQV